MDEYELVLQQLQMNIPIAAIQALLEKRTDSNYSYDQLTAIHAKAAHTLVLGDISSPAERLMRKFISKHEQRRLARLRTTTLQSLSQTACLTVISELDAMKAVLLDLLVPEAVKDLLQQYKAANDYLFFQVSEEKFYVKKFHWESFDSQDPVMRYNRTRIVEGTTDQSGRLVATCSCRRFNRKGRPCQHLYCILGRGPLVTDCDVKQLKWFEAYHGCEEQFTRQSKALIKNRLPGPPVQIPLMIEDSRHANENKT
jgi:hypothetical protein